MMSGNKRALGYRTLLLLRARLYIHAGAQEGPLPLMKSHTSPEITYVMSGSPTQNTDVGEGRPNT